MSKPKHTPGPWVIHYTHPASNEAEITQMDNRNELIGELGEIEAEKTYANARLIAAAPDAHDILLLLRRFVNEGARQISFGALMDTDDETTLEQAVKAYFTKATGGE